MNNGQQFYSAVKRVVIGYRFGKYDGEHMANLLESNMLAFEAGESPAHIDKPRDWDEFLAMATDTFVRKDTDYNSRFMRGLVQRQNDRGLEAARTIWAWEVEKKLDRLRSYLERGKLLVESEGVANSVQDLFIYTVQFTLFLDHIKPFQVHYALHALNERSFYEYATKKKAIAWTEFLVEEGLIANHEFKLKQLIIKYMTGV